MFAEEKMTTKSPVEKLTTEEFGKLILENPGVIFDFSTHKQCSFGDLIGEFAWYSIASFEIFQVQTVVINCCAPGGGSFHAFDLPDFDVSEGEPIKYSACLEDVLRGLNDFNYHYGEERDTWWLPIDYKNLDKNQILSVVYS
jgi:hypothetical protein